MSDRAGEALFRTRRVGDPEVHPTRPLLLAAGGLVLFAGLYVFRLTSLGATPVLEEIAGFVLLISAFLVGALFLSAGFRMKRPQRVRPSPRDPG